MVYLYTAISIKVVSKTKEIRSNMSAKGLSGKTSLISEYINIYRFSTKFKIRSCFLMNINRDYVSLETTIKNTQTEQNFTPSKHFALVFDFSAMLGDNLNIIEIAVYYFITVCKDKFNYYFENLLFMLF